MFFSLCLLMMICIFKYYKYIQQTINTYYLEYRGIECDDINVNYNKTTKFKTNILSCYDDSDDEYNSYSHYDSYDSYDNDSADDDNLTTNIKNINKNNFVKSESEELFCKYH